MVEPNGQILYETKPFEDVARVARQCGGIARHVDDAPRPAATTTQLPPTVDVLVIGSGYTGLMAARDVSQSSSGSPSGESVCGTKP